MRMDPTVLPIKLTNTILFINQSIYITENAYEEKGDIHIMHGRAYGNCIVTKMYQEAFPI